MFEKEAEEIANKRCHEIMCFGHCSFSSPKHHRCGEWHREYNCAKEGIEFGYNKAFVEADKNLKAVVADFNKTNEWHKDLPTEDVELAIIEVEDCGYLLCEYRKCVWYDKGSSAVCKDWITRNIKRWKEIVLPKESE